MSAFLVYLFTFLVYAHAVKKVAILSDRDMWYNMCLEPMRER